CRNSTAARRCRNNERKSERGMVAPRWRKRNEKRSMTRAATQIIAAEYGMSFHNVMTKPPTCGRQATMANAAYVDHRWHPARTSARHSNARAAATYSDCATVSRLAEPRTISEIFIAITYAMG